MVDGPVSTDATLIPKRPGERLREARIAAGLELADVAARTRVPTRHLESIEASDFSGLPSTTYAMGFAKAYARALGVDEVGIARDVRAELAQNWQPAPLRPEYVPADPARVPGRGVALAGALVAVLALIFAGLWFGTDLLRGTSASTEVAAPAADLNSIAVPPPGQSVSQAPAPSASGQVSLTATDTVWVRIYDAADKTLLMKEMAPGERYDVPTDANGPLINIGRPDKLAISINGSNVPALGDGRRAIKDVPIGAAALLARDSATTLTPTAPAN
jgi:transcriptional regulator with XRE-family HTH domain